MANLIPKVTAFSIDDKGTQTTLPTNASKLSVGKPTAVAPKLRAKTALADDGDNHLAAPTGAAWGTSSFNQAFSWPAFSDPFTNSGSQTAGGEINGTFNVYALTDGEYMVIYVESGSVNPGSLLVNDSAARGYFQGSFATQVAPYLVAADGTQTIYPGCYWVADSPANVNQNTTLQASVSSTASQTVTVSVGPDGATAGYSATNSTTLSNSVTNVISDWGINDNTVAQQCLMSWEFQQQMPFEYDETMDNFKSNYGNCYDSQQGVKDLPALSTSSAQYSTIAIWKFPAPSGNSLVVSFQGSFTHGLAFLGTPGYQQNGHHKVFRYGYELPWTWQIDLVQVAQQGQ